MEKPTDGPGTVGSAERPPAAARLRPPRVRLEYHRVRRVPVRPAEVVGSVLLGLCWAGMAAVGLVAIAGVTLVVFNHQRRDMTRAEVVTLWLVTLASVTPPTVVAARLALRYLIREPLGRVRAVGGSPAGRSRPAAPRSNERSNPHGGPL